MRNIKYNEILSSAFKYILLSKYIFYYTYIILIYIGPIANIKLIIFIISYF